MNERKKSTIYTKKGDAGETKLASMSTVSKADLRLETYGTVDELNSNLGIIRAMQCDPKTSEILGLIQHELFNLGSDLAFEDGTHPKGLSRIVQMNVSRLEEFIDELDVIVPPLQRFILPGGCKTAAQLHVSRTVCRRAERQLVRFLKEDTCNPVILPYLNRLSDLLFVMARYENTMQEIDDIPWQK